MSTLELDPTVAVQTKGIEGVSFTEQGGKQHYERLGIRPRFVAYETHQQAVTAVETGETDEAFLPIDNTTSGRVTTGVAAARDAEGLTVAGSEGYKVDQFKGWLPGTDPKKAKIVHSQGPAIDQCEKSIAEDGYEPSRGLDTYGSAVELVDGKGSINGQPAVVIASAAALELLGLEYDPEHPYQDNPNNVTTMWRLRRGEHNRNGTHTSFTFEVPDEPGGLHRAIGLISVEHGLNLTDIDSHLASPSGRGFYAEIEHEDETPDDLMLDMLAAGLNPRLMGTYEKYRPNHGSVSDVLKANSWVPPAIRHDKWNGREGLLVPEGSRRIYVETGNEKASLYRALGALSHMNLLDMSRPATPTVPSGEPDQYHRGFYFVTRPESPQALQKALDGLKDNNFSAEVVG